ncbi:phosphonate ABC transporter, permease protein PhnE [Sulfitobacter sp. M57]|uniref:phosphonate ABC transporter, permease protein PhnE n=1 Tax=unclassified Sulfitobacter TaxID=196795 RepID=UPI0023E1778A|nr:MULTISPECIES: phosphonate ABC transporter, permease protein PhnE [unclassified Sulfitobacter]MDF3415126.1 phosphonate ABC transporter, permease protein PhnE [Sulfitobacter sp. KE5]MDF3422607.1 phosphonate ABC transporter, permease protein PhnE [Sulfitobacter sp. KE43]MDF3433672.1 phosphonate ABC transporter, permease protein PhnE [Sulfitobacter sp. KE42]MDF3459312.1 phosphonate ABC transporter, permease protein PhnE [Sulfitobacter sp. S74]MDF3463211.1 phosphonate ABC transporter, permease p
MTAIDLNTTKQHADRLFQRKRLIGFGIPAVIAVYFLYIFFAFDFAGLAQRANLENAVTLASDSWSHKVHVTRDNRSGETTYAVEGERKGRYPDGQRPEWVTGKDVISIDIGGDHIVRYLPQNRTEIDIPGMALIKVQAKGRKLTHNLPEDRPDWISVSDRRIGIVTPEGRITMTGARTEVFNYFPGWELFWFTLDSPYHGHSVASIMFGERLDPARSNINGALSDWWNNAMWRHKDVAWAIGETILMAFLGTMGAAIIALPLAFFAAKRFSPFMVVRATARRLFDFVRGVDALIWTVVLARAFGPGPLTGALAILITDTGTFGKIFSEALENVDQKQIEGVASTGAKPLQRYRFGVIPQVVPVLLAQILYFLESNTRSATIIGAITGGGIGLMLTQAIQTQKDWEEVAYYIILIIVMVMFMDWFSGWLRGKLIGRKN